MIYSMVPVSKGTKASGSFAFLDQRGLQGYLNGLAGCLSGSVGVVVDEKAWRTNDFCGKLSLKTSGTSGSPKTVHRKLEASSFDKRKKMNGVWFSAYRPDKWAGISTSLHAFSTSAQISFSLKRDPTSMIDTLMSDSPDFIACTPTFFRIINSIASESLQELPVKLVTFGGEVATQSDLDAVRRIWPDSRVRHTYATTELGDVLVSSDAYEGFTLDVVQAKKALEISPQGELIVNGRATGDFWSISNNRLLFSHRETDFAKVGGHRVDLSALRKKLQSISRIDALRISVKKDKMLGEIVVLEYAGSISKREIRLELSDLPREMIPTVVRNVSSDAFSTTWKGR